MDSQRNAYAVRAINQIPRILGNMDRNKFSQTYGCCHRDYWLDKTSDFPDAVRQFGVHALALTYKTKMPGNKYYRKKKIFEWAVAGLDYWASIQHSDGSFDEFYPNERGWVGPTAFTTFTSIESYILLREKMPKKISERIVKAIRRAAHFIAKGESEEDHLANHHAMACLAVWKAYKVLQDKKLLQSYKMLWKNFLTYHNSDEGWSREYDGIDPGYLSATISFLGKIYQENKDPDILRVCKQSIETCSHFVFPNGFFAGSVGSRNTMHFYSHGFEIFAKEIPMAASIAEKMLIALAEGKLVPPEIMADRYMFYRVPELLQSYIDYKERPTKLKPLPFEQKDLNCYLPEAKIWIKADPEIYIIANLAKGGVIKLFDKFSNKLIHNDCGFIGKLDTGKVITSQWINPEYKIEVSDKHFEISGAFNIVPSNKFFNVPKLILFRIVLLLIGWNTKWAHYLKGWIRKILMLGNRPINIWFKRELRMNENGYEIIDEVKNKDSVKIKKLFLGDEFFVRYVPQSRYFQSQELDLEGFELRDSDLKMINSKKDWSVRRAIYSYKK
ncbi:MAG: hypothetical protein CBB97_15895 [Candidatus Endolissoclinum sp. TMED37]|nr:MAG: hypothetical protein CBB97_15895 [Candidatus Endolissoclinum sp. TMED37]|tara:strand:+ start:790 stop:2460 length:1671 start_codon:yes stop_codon:yes gene_type:complete